MKRVRVLKYVWRYERQSTVVDDDGIAQCDARSEKGDSHVVN